MLNGTRIAAASGIAIDFPKIAGPKPLVERLGGMREGETLHPRILDLWLYGWCGWRTGGLMPHLLPGTAAIGTLPRPI